MTEKDTQLWLGVFNFDEKTHIVRILTVTLHKKGSRFLIFFVQLAQKGEANFDQILHIG